MQLIPEQDDEMRHKLSKLKKFPKLLSDLNHSTCSVSGMLTGVDFIEEEVIDFMECSGNIVSLDCNYGHKVSTTKPPAAIRKKSNRGRKKKEKPKKSRKVQGDGSSFNSQITFGTMGTFKRKIPEIPDKHCLTSEKLEGGYEIVSKIYKIKIFRNGSVTTPGILSEELLDIQKPLDEICTYLSSVFCSEVKKKYLVSVMKNYKCRLLEHKIDIRNLQRHCEVHFQKLLNTSFSDITAYLVNPVFEKDAKSPMFDGWNAMFSSSNWPEVVPTYGYDLGEKFSEANAEHDHFNISYPEMKQFLFNSSNLKNLYVNFLTMVIKLSELNLHENYSQLRNFYEAVYYNFYEIENGCYKIILKYLMKDKLEILKKCLTKSSDNMMSFIKYNPEKYPGFLIRIKTPTILNQDKRTTLKIFLSGKVNIDGANSFAEAEFIYYWFNRLLYKNPKLIDRNDFDYDAHDSEFSSDSEEEITDEDN